MKVISNLGKKYSMVLEELTQGFGDLTLSTIIDPESLKFSNLHIGGDKEYEKSLK
jgi:hypothetical protein